MKIAGRDLRVGDTIAVWRRAKQDTITGLVPFTGPFAIIYPEGARLADFKVYRVGIIDNAKLYNLLARDGKRT